VLKQAILQAADPVLLSKFLPAPVRAEGEGSSAPSERPELAKMTKFIEGRLRAGSSNLLGEVLTLVERRLFLQVSRHSRSNLSQVGRILRITRSTARNWNRSASRSSARPPWEKSRPFDFVSRGDPSAFPYSALQFIRKKLESTMSHVIALSKPFCMFGTCSVVPPPGFRVDHRSRHSICKHRFAS
jgi:hypothetical protein